MQYRNFGKEEQKVSALGFGCMRLPTTDGSHTGPIDEREAIRMIHRALDAGVNYFDTAKVYHEGCAESLLGKALAGSQRHQLKVATKLPLWGTRGQSDCEKIFEEQLRDLQTDCIDVYLFHSLQDHLWKKVLDWGLIDWAEKKRKEGKIKRLGFSFHDSLGLFKEILNYHSWDVCMLQYNYVATNIQAGIAGVQYAGTRGIPVVIMEPLFGGVLANPQGKMEELFANSPHNPVDLALRWVWDQPEVSLLLSGMSTMQQVEQNLEIADRSQIGSFSEAEKSFVAQLQAEYERAMPIKCTKCRYCLPCPQTVAIPEIFEIYNNLVALPATEQFDKLVYSLQPHEKQASNCSSCGVCEGRCPQRLPIRELLKTAHARLT
ncbi:MAG: aldo/keto reductase [Thermoguttaceae bacterium]